MTVLPILFEDHTSARFRPLSWSQPQTEMRCGMFSLRERMGLLAPDGGALAIRPRLQPLGRDPRWTPLCRRRRRPDPVAQRPPGPGFPAAAGPARRRGRGRVRLVRRCGPAGPGGCRADGDGRPPVLAGLGGRPRGRRAPGPGTRTLAAADSRRLGARRPAPRQGSSGGGPRPAAPAVLRRCPGPWAGSGRSCPAPPAPWPATWPPSGISPGAGTPGAWSPTRRRGSRPGPDRPGWRRPGPATWPAWSCAATAGSTWDRTRT